MTGPARAAGSQQRAVAPPVVIAQVSDIHLGAHVDDLAESLLEDVAGHHPTATVVCGDLTMRARSHQLVSAAGYLGRLPQPLLVVLGNHDIPLYDLGERLLHPYRKYQRHVSQELDPVLRVEGATLLGLNTMPRWRWKAGRVSDRQSALVGQVLGAAPADDLRVLVTHHPVLPEPLSGLVGRGALVAAAAGARVDLLLSGHTHLPQVALVRLGRDGSPARSALSVVAGTAVSTRTRGGAGNSYQLLEVAPATLTVTHRVWDGRAWVSSASEVFRRGADGPVRSSGGAGG